MSAPVQPQLHRQPVIRQRRVDPDALVRLNASGIHPVLSRVLAARGVASEQDIDQGLEGLIPPLRMGNLDRASQVLADAIKSKQKLLIVADYDADGATACAVAMRGLARFGARVEFLVPDRFVFGYGLTPALVEHAARLHADDPIDWIITVDNGISSIAGVEAAKALGIQVLITDHHLAGRSLPDTLIVNPNQPSCKFPSKHLAGVGVMFYVLMGLRGYFRDIEKWSADRIPRLDDLLPIVALGTVADVVRLDANNRRLVAQGLTRLRRGSSFAGLNALFQVSGIPVRQASTRDLGFSIGPRINAAGRLSDMTIGIQCLLEDDEDRAMMLAEQLDTLNRERREIESDAREEATAQALEIMGAAHSGPGQQAANTNGGAGMDKRLGVVLHDPRWHQGVIGLIAGRLKDQFYQPTIVFADDPDGQNIKGSCRSIPGVHIRDILERIDTMRPGLIKAFGGHAMAAGLTLAKDSLAEFTEIFGQTLHALTDPEDLQQILETDGPLEPEYLRIDIAQMLSQQIWGQGFPPPVFVNEFRVIAQRRIKERHLKLTLAPQARSLLPGQDSDSRSAKSAQKIEAIWFNAPHDLRDSAEIAYRLAINEWQGRASVQLEVVGVT